MGLAEDRALVEDCVGGYFADLDQNWCVSEAERDAARVDRDEAMAALQRIYAAATADAASS